VDAVVVFLAGAATALATGVGAIPVFMLGRRVTAAQPALSGLALGVMCVASFQGLLLPALRDGGRLSVAVGLVAGALFVAAARLGLGSRRARRRIAGNLRRSILVFGVLLVHSLPEGFAIGAAWASETAGLGLFVVLAIALQNVPEGTAVAVPLEAAGVSGGRQLAAAVASSAPQPVGALAAFLLVEQIRGLLPASLAFAAGAMLTVVVLELVPDAWRQSRGPASVGALAGAALMLAISQLLTV
jgi:ZIP family zinc transporter